MNLINLPVMTDTTTITGTMWTTFAAIAIAVASVLFTLFAKSIFTIVQKSMAMKDQMATKKEQREFEDSIRDELRSYKQELQDAVLNACMKVIDDRLKDIKDIQTTASSMTATKAIIEVELKQVMEKYDEIKNISDYVRNLGNDVNQLKYGKNASVISERRSESNSEKK
jgi:methyl-accepting chemotaxis protein